MTEKLNQLLNNKKYYENAQEVAQVFRDNPIHPMDEAIFYIEYVMRHKGAKYLKSAGRELYWYQHLLLDVFCLWFAAISSLIVAFYVCLKLVRTAMGNNNKVRKTKQS